MCVPCSTCLKKNSLKCLGFITLISDENVRGSGLYLLSKQNFIPFWPPKSIDIYIVTDWSNENSPMMGLNQLYSIHVKQNALCLYSYFLPQLFDYQLCFQNVNKWYYFILRPPGTLPAMTKFKLLVKVLALQPFIMFLLYSFTLLPPLVVEIVEKAFFKGSISLKTYSAQAFLLLRKFKRHQFEKISRQNASQTSTRRQGQILFAVTPFHIILCQHTHSNQKEARGKKKSWWQPCERNTRLKTSKQTARFIFCFGKFS